MLQQQSKTRRKPGRPKGSGPTPGSWKPGQSGNPNFTPTSQARLLAHTIMSQTVDVRDQLAAKIVEQAMNGCLQSQRLLVERFMPQVRAQTLAQPLPGIDKGSIEERLQAVLAAAAQGTLSADEAKTWIDGIRGATEAAAIANAERELESIRQMRQQVIARDDSRTLQIPSGAAAEPQDRAIDV
jgi:hypothetical protein